jgi:hypothetical protein
VLGRRGKDEEAEAMHRQTLAAREKVLGAENPDTLASVYYLAYLLGNQYRFEQATPLFKRACSGYNIILGHNHPTTRTCYRHYSDMLASQEQETLSTSSIIPSPPDNGGLEA